MAPSVDPAAVDVDLDVTGLGCPMPLLKAKQALNGMQTGQLLKVTATDPGSWKDFEVFATQSGHALEHAAEHAGTFTYVLRCR